MRAAWDVDPAGCCEYLPFPASLSDEVLDDDVLEDLLTACVLLLLHETPAGAAQLHGALVALRLHEDPAVVQRILEALEELDFVEAAGPRAHPTFQIAPAGAEWLACATTALQDTEGFLGAFVARCEERFV